MDDSSTAAVTLDQADDELLNYIVSDEALEAAAGTVARPTTPGQTNACAPYCGVGGE